MFIHRIKKMSFDEDFAEYQRCLIASSVADTYEEAIKEKYRFFSFGDAMFIR